MFFFVKGFPEALSTYAAGVDHLFFTITYLVGFWFVIAEAVLFYLIFAFKRSEGKRAMYIGGDNAKELAWVMIPLALIVLCDVKVDLSTVPVWKGIKQTLPKNAEKIRVIGQQWSWIFVHEGPDGQLNTSDDIALVNELHVKVGTKVQFELESKDVMHSFSVPVFRLKQDIIPGRKISGWFEATKTGEYDIQCTEICGIGHGVMAARIKIETKSNYDHWMASMTGEQAASETLATASTEATGDFAKKLQANF